MGDNEDVGRTAELPRRTVSTAPAEVVRVDGVVGPNDAACGRAAGPRWWQWPTILSVDAPLIALFWQWIFARAVAADIGWEQRAVLTIGVHGVYVLDRALDARAIGVKAVSIRHRFYAQAPRGFLRYAIALLGGACLLGCITAPAPLRNAALVLALAIGLYTAFIHAPLTRHLGAWVKEVLVGGLFALGVVLAPFFSTEESVNRGLWLAGAGFIFLCMANTLSISWFERRTDAAQGTPSLTTTIAGRISMPVALSIFLFAAAVPLLLSLVAPITTASAMLGLCLFLSFSLLGLLHISQRRFSTEQLRVLVDTALLTPCVFAVVALISG